jgi:hypothetical protein
MFKFLLRPLQEAACESLALVCRERGSGKEREEGEREGCTMGIAAMHVAIFAAAMLPCTAFFAPSAIHSAVQRNGFAPAHCRVALGPQVPRLHAGGALGLYASGSLRRPPPPPPRRPPPPPAKDAAPGAARANHEKIKDPQLNAGVWREELGLGLNRLSSSVTGARSDGRKTQKGPDNESRASSKPKMKKRSCCALRALITSNVLHVYML